MQTWISFQGSNTGHLPVDEGATLICISRTFRGRAMLPRSLEG